MDRITNFSLKNAAAIVILAVVIIFGGLWSATQLKKESMPDVDIPYVVVVTPYPGAAPQDVYDAITDPIEKAVGGVAGVKLVRAQSSDSVSMVVAEFGYSSDMEKAESDINKAVAGVTLPDSAMEPTVSRISFGGEPVVRLSVTAASTTAALDGATGEEALRSAISDKVLPALSGVEGVGGATLESDSPYSVSITFHEKALADKGLTVAGVVQQLQAANISYPVGAVDLGDSTEPIRVTGSFTELADIENFQVAVYPDSAKIMGEALSSLGSGIAKVGSATGEVALQTGLVNGIQQMQAQLYTLKYDTLPPLRAALAQVPPNSPQYQQLTAQIAKIEDEAIPGIEQAIAGLQSQIGASQKKMKAAAKEKAATPSEPAIGVVALADVATITYGPADGTVGSRANGEPAALISVTKTQDANTVDVASAVRDKMAEIESALPSGAKVEYVYDASTSINASIRGMLREGLLGALFAIVIILVFLRNWRATIIATISIPLSMLVAIVAIKLTGITLNVMTLGGLTVAIGRVIDDAIVVIENIFRHLQRGEERNAATIRRATAEVSSAITSSTLTTVAVFIPLGLVTGIIGKVFQPFAMTVGIAMLASLLVAVTVVPLMARWMLLRGKVPAHRDETVNPSRTTKAYRSLLGWALGHRAIVALLAVALLVGSIALVPLVGTGFLPETKEKYASIEVQYPEGSKSSAVDATVTKVEALLAKNGDIDYYQATVGTGNGTLGLGSGLGGTNKASLFVRFSEDADLDATLAGLREQAAPLQTDGVTITITAISAAGSSSGDLQLIVTGDSMADIRSASETVAGAITDVADLENVTNNLGVSRPEVTVTVNEEKAAAAGLNTGLITQTVRGLVADQSLGTAKINGEATEITYATSLSDQDREAKLKSLVLTNPLGEDVALTDVASVEETGSTVAVLTRDGIEYAMVSGHITARNSGAVITAVKEKLATLDLPQGVNVEVSGTAEIMSESFSQLGLAMMVAIAAVYLVMVVTFGEAAAPLAIMMSLPLAVVGGLFGLFVAGMPLDVPAMIGALMLIGIVVTNAIVLVDRVRTNTEHKGMARREALLEAGSTRMRPILMTAIATVIALVPLAMGSAEGALISQSLAVIVIGGLTTSTLLTLVVVPVAYDLLEGAKDRLFKRAAEVPAGE